MKLSIAQIVLGIAISIMGVKVFLLPLGLAFLILGFSRVVSKDVPLSISLIFYGMSWFIWLLILRDFAGMFNIRRKSFVIRLNFLMLFAIANLSYAILIILSV